jgi:hypothetical protein
VSKILAQCIFFIGRPHHDTCINASNASSFNRLLWSLFTQFCLEKPRSHISCACQDEVVANAKSKLHSQNCRSYWKLEVYAKMPRLESNYVFICKLQSLYFVTSIFLEKPSTEKGENYVEHIFVKCPPPLSLFWWPKWHLTSVEDFNIEHWLQSSNKEPM